MKKEQPLITVFTPAFNRAHTLPRTYESLLSQTCDDFVWMIVDDGSTDDTEMLVKGWKGEDRIPIIYIKRENGGMHQAHNTAYQNITTELNVCIDSDDYMPVDAIENIKRLWLEKGEERYAGMIGLDIDTKGRLIGSGFADSLTETTLTDFYKKGGKGDKKLVYRTDVVKEYPPYPAFDNEKYVGLDYLYTLIDLDYRLLVLNKPLVVVEYLADGSTNNMWGQYWRNPNGWIFYRKHQLSLNQTFRNRMKIAAQLVSHAIRAGKNPFRDNRWKAITAAAFPIGIILFVYNYLRVKK